MFRHAHPGSKALLLGVAFALAGCASSGHYIWYTELPRNEWGSQSPTESPEYVIGPGDVISIKIYEQEGLGGTAKVRSDGRIALTLIGEVSVVGKHPAAFARELEELLKRFIVAPRVTVNVESSQPVSVTMLGELKSAGTQSLESPPRMLEAIAKAGGLSEFASEDAIYVLRPYPTFRKIRFTYKAILNNENGAAGFLLRTGDVILVE